MSSPQGFSRGQRQRILRKSQTAGRMRPTRRTAPTNIKLQQAHLYIWQNDANTTGQQWTYSAVTAIPTNQALIQYKHATFHTIERDNSYLYPFEDIPHILIRGRYSRATLPKNEIVFMHIFERRHAATRDVLQACRTYASHAIRKRIGIAMQSDAHGDPVTVVTDKKPSLARNRSLQKTSEFAP